MLISIDDLIVIFLMTLFNTKRIYQHLKILK